MFAPSFFGLFIVQFVDDLAQCNGNTEKCEENNQDKANQFRVFTGIGVHVRDGQTRHYQYPHKKQMFCFHKCIFSSDKQSERHSSTPDVRDASMCLQPAKLKDAMRYSEVENEQKDERSPLHFCRGSNPKKASKEQS